MGAEFRKKLGTLLVRVPCSAAKDTRGEAGGGIGEVYRLAIEAFPTHVAMIAFRRNEMTLELLMREGDDPAELTARARSFLPDCYRSRTTEEFWERHYRENPLGVPPGEEPCPAPLA